MHVHELNPKKTLVAVIIFVLIIIIGFLTLKKPRFTYKLSPEQTLQLLHDEEALFHPYKLVEVLNKKNNNVVLIDIRDRFTYGQGHIPGAENISAYDLTDMKNIEHLKELQDANMTVVLYGNDQLQANGPWMWFRQVGFDNVKILLGGYGYYATHKNSLALTINDTSYLKGTPKYDYAKVASNVSAAGNSQKTSSKKPVVIRRKKKAAVAAGGC
ncbi:MAG: rhodanese-like domain-containing protein [Chlorobi bacterium]|nr:rhodanese-like domain-containing protein [Chlorobiota bacterium]